MLVVGAKLEVIVAKMAFRIDDQNRVSRGTPLVHPNDNLFWFGQPRFVLVLIHFVLFVVIIPPLYKLASSIDQKENIIRN